ncbi:YibE/F family protein [Luteipulveratus halotolerans]|nr:YibE/F family protein [Luteipulveratus halotolerans]
MLLAATLVPVALLTVLGLITLWPHDVDHQIRKDVVRTGGTTFVPGTIQSVRPVSCGETDASAGSPQAADAGAPDDHCAVLRMGVDGGPERGTLVDVTVDAVVLALSPHPGQRLQLARAQIPGEQPAYQFADFERDRPLALIAALFVLVVVLVARWRGLLALLGLGVAGAVLVLFVFPALITGAQPVLVGLVGSLAIMYVVLYCTHGFSVRTSTALLGTVFGLALAALLGWGATRWTHLTGAVSDDDYLLGQAAPHMHLTAVVMCGMIIAGLGVLNDVTITQASAVWELAEAGAGDNPRSLYRRAIRIGRDHIASTIYTIAFAWAGASLGTLLLISVYDRPLLDVARSELIAAELVSTLVGSIALVLSVPVTTAVAVAVVSQARERTTPRTVATADI